MTNLNVNKFFYLILTFFLLLFFGSIVLVDGYPHNNDILHIFKISSLPDNLKFVNGSFLPGYTYYSLIFSNSLIILTFLICVLIITSSLILIKLIKSVSLNQSDKEKLILYIYSLLLHIIIITTVGLNHSDCIFVLLFYNGLLYFVYGYYYSKIQYNYLVGALIIGISLLFRHHGLIAIILIFINFIFFEINYLKKKLNLISSKLILISITILFPLIISQLHILTIDANAEWQTTLKLNYFVYGHTWGDWRDIKNILNSEQSRNFNILNVETNHLIKVILGHIKSTFVIIYPFILCFLISFFISKKKIIIISLIIFIIYLLIISPGYGRGYYPALFFCLIPILINYKKFINNKILSILIFIFLSGHLIYIAERYIENTVKYYSINKDIKENVVKILNNKKIRYENIFSDDYSFYSTQLDGDINKICNWGGWILAHPYYKNYYPKDAILRKNKNYCDVKAVITRDEKFANKYMNTNIYKQIYKTEKFFILTID